MYTRCIKHVYVFTVETNQVVCHVSWCIQQVWKLTETYMLLQEQAHESQKRVKCFHPCSLLFIVGWCTWKGVVSSHTRSKVFCQASFELRSSKLYRQNNPPKNSEFHVAVRRKLLMEMWNMIWPKVHLRIQLLLHTFLGTLVVHLVCDRFNEFQLLDVSLKQFVRLKNCMERTMTVGMDCDYDKEYVCIFEVESLTLAFLQPATTTAKLLLLRRFPTDSRLLGPPAQSSSGRPLFHRKAPVNQLSEKSKRTCGHDKRECKVMITRIQTHSVASNSLVSLFIIFALQ